MMSTNTKGISVIICCHNSSVKIEATLGNLALQIKQPGTEYEIILVDNNCTDNTIETAQECWRSLHNPFPLCIIQETKTGLSYARQKGIAAAKYEYVVLCDDDNWLCKDYLKKVFMLFETMPDVALLGGVGEAVFENGTAPAWFTNMKGFGYAVGAEGRKTGYTFAVYGAGMGIRKSVFEIVCSIRQKRKRDFIRWRC
jgi:glycosyltransferase involved in cell wall biosynthesis